MKVKLSDYLATRLRDTHGVSKVFMVTGGGAMHLNDSFGTYLDYVCFQHEQGAAMAAEGYARAGYGKPRLALVNVTTGPGGLNCLNGVFGQWTDSVPVLYVSGQVKKVTCMSSYPNLKVRQLGDQEVDILSCVRPLTKYAAQVTDPQEIRYHLDKAVHEALCGRPGPVWLDIPIDVQSALIDPETLTPFNELQRESPVLQYPLWQDFKSGTGSLSKAPDSALQDLESSPSECAAQILERLLKARRPLVVAGQGIRLSGTVSEFRAFIERLQVPAVLTFNGGDLLESRHPLYVGKIGTIGQRAGNFALQNADAVLMLGTRNNIRQVSYNWENFAKKAFKMAVDIDPQELAKPLCRPDLCVRADLAVLLPELLRQSAGQTGSEADRAGAGVAAATDSTAPGGGGQKSNTPGKLAGKFGDEPAGEVKPQGEVKPSDVNCSTAPWLAYCHMVKERFSFERTVEYQPSSGAKLNPYYFTRRLTEQLKSGDHLISANATPSICIFQAGDYRGQRVIMNSGDASMGYGLPCAVGAALREGLTGQVICCEGDGSIMMNLQELMTVAHYRLPLKIFVYSNGGYAAIRMTQRNFFKGHLVGSDLSSGLGMPDFVKVGESFGLRSCRIADGDKLDEKIKEVLEAQEPVLCEVVLAQDYSFSPKLGARVLPDGSMVSPSLEDMSPFLERTEVEELSCC